MNNQKKFSGTSLILALNPRIPFTRIGVYENAKRIYFKEINHPKEELIKFKSIYEQVSYRKDAIFAELKEKKININDIEIIVSRGGFLKPVKSGIYMVNEKIIEDLIDCKIGNDIINIGGLIADDIAKDIPDANAYIADPVVVDEFDDIARVTGIPEIKRKSIFHALNQKAIGKRYANTIGKKYEELNLIIAHLGSGITIGAHCKGRVIDANQGYDGDGPFSAIRAGSLPVGDLINLCYSGKYTKEEILRKVSCEGGLHAHLGTHDAYEIEKNLYNGDEKSLFIFDAMVYQVAKAIGSMVPVLFSKVNAILITGAIAQSNWFVERLMERVGSLAPVSVYPGSDDIESLALKGLAVLREKEEVLEYK
ncbi:MAG: butyrate kinase [Bacteroidales bacterium]|nr:butyrate kinase [Bacteroidales bacterium]